MEVTKRENFVASSVESLEGAGFGDSLVIASMELCTDVSWVLTTEVLRDIEDVAQVAIFYVEFRKWIFNLQNSGCCNYCTKEVFSFSNREQCWSVGYVHYTVTE